MLAAMLIPFSPLTSGLAELLGLPHADVQNAFWTMAVGAVCAICCSLVGCFLLLRRMSLLGDALSHSVLAGVAGAYLVTGTVDPIPMLIGALAAGVLTAVLTQFVHRVATVPEDSSIGIVFTCLFAFGVVVVSQARHVHLDLKCVLFGDLAFAGVKLKPVVGYLLPESFVMLIPAMLATLLFLFLFWKELKLSSFDPTLAVTLGFGTATVHYLLTTVVAMVTVSSMEVVGLLVVALLIVPPATARLLTDRLGTMLLLACLVGVVSTSGGYLLAVAWHSSAAGLSAVVSGALLLVAVIFSPRNGVLRHLVRSIQLRIRIGAEDVLAGLFRRQEHAPDPAVVVTPLECYQLAGGGFLASFSVSWLRKRQLLRASSNGVSLTEAGQQYARSLVRSHRLWETYLLENFDLAEDHLHDPAEEMEHFIGPELQEQIVRELDAPVADPHGRAIPDRNDRSV